MRGNRRRDTGPEQRLRSALHGAGWRFRVDLPVDCGGTRCRPDIAFTHWRVAVFVDGCFWHGCPQHGVPPKTNTSYWGPKLARNRERDRRDTGLLGESGWTVVRVWEHLPADQALPVVEAALLAQGASPRTARSRKF
jgi:DNA mismatch endonuclease (patch repair protein)